MLTSFTRRMLLASAAALAVSATTATTAMAQDKIKLRLSAVQTETDQRSVAMLEKFAPMVSDFADFDPHWNGSLFQQGTELEAIASGDLEMSIASAQELAQKFGLPYTELSDFSFDPKAVAIITESDARRLMAVRI